MEKPVLLFDIDETVFDTGAFRDSGYTMYQIYPDVIPVLTALSSLATLGIFSEAKNEFRDGKPAQIENELTAGAYEFQMGKLTKTHIDHFFAKEHLHIVGNKPASFKSVLTPYQTDSIYFIEDKLPMLQEAANVLPDLKTIWIRRGRYAQAQKPIPGFTPDHTIDSLAEIESIVKHDIDR